MSIRAVPRRARRALAAAVLVVRDRAVRWTERPRAFVRPVTGVVSGPAWWALVLAIAGWFASAHLLHWAELAVASRIVLMLLLCCSLFVLGINQVAARIDLGRDRIVVGEQASGAVALTNVLGRRVLPLIVELPVGRVVAEFDVPSLAAHAVHEELFSIPTHRRAVIEVGPVRAIRADPLRLLNRDRVIEPATTLYVHPRTVAVESAAAGLVRDLEGSVVRTITDSDMAFHALRAYVPGDDRRFIHWKSSARTGTLMVRQFEETRRAHMLVVLSTRLGEYADADEFETAVSVAGSLGKQVLIDEQDLTLATSMRRLRTSHARVTLDELSGVDFDADAPRIPLGVRAVERTPTGASVAVLLCGSTVSAGLLRRARSYLSPDVRTIAVRVDHDAETTMRPMGALDLVTLADLDDLPMIVRRLAA